MAQTLLIIPLFLGAIGFIAFAWGRDTAVFSGWLGRFTVVASAILLFISIVMAAAPANQYPLEFSLNLLLTTVDFHIDALSLYFMLLVNVIAFAATWNAISYLGDQLPEHWVQRPSFFHSSVNLFHFTMLLVPALDNLIGVWIAIELTTLFSAFLVSHQNNRESWEAAWKYLIITSTGIILALWGTMFLSNAAYAVQESGITGNEIGNEIMNWTSLIRLARSGALATEQALIKLSFLFILVGYGTKAGLAPMHTWLPDGHGEAPAPISALLSGVLLKSALYVILRFYTIANTSLGGSTFTSIALLVAGLLSLLLAVPFILKENHFKRILAYHSLEHMGIITFGMGIGGAAAMFGALLHSLNHAIAKALMFLSYGNILRQYRAAAPTDEAFDATRIVGVLRSMPITGTILTLGGLALVGAPPFSIFMSEFMILWGALSSKKTVLEPWIIHTAVILFMLSTTLIFFGLVRHLSKIVLGKMPGEPELEEKPMRDLFPLILLFILILIMGIWIMPGLADIIARSVAIVLEGSQGI